MGACISSKTKTVVEAQVQLKARANAYQAEPITEYDERTSQNPTTISAKTPHAKMPAPAAASAPIGSDGYTDLSIVRRL
jgi:hypothetical protein